MKMLLKICFVLLLTTFSIAYAGSCFEKPYDVDDCRVKAEQGHSRAQYNLGWMYYHGNGVLQEYKESVRWYRKSAEQGYSKAQYNLGVMYAKGQGVPKDSERAQMYWKKAAVSDHEEAIKGRTVVEKKK